MRRRDFVTTTLGVLATSLPQHVESGVRSITIR
jgi:hypothetical protein